MTPEVRKTKKRKSEAVVVVEEAADADDYKTTTGGNELVLPGAKKKKKARKTKEELAAPEKKLNKKKLERRAEIEAAKVKKLSKTKEKALATLQTRKEKKQTLESLFEALKEYQIDASTTSGLISSKHRNDKDVRNDKGRSQEVVRDPIFPSKVRSVKGSVLSGDKQRIQKNYYETDSSTDDDGPPPGFVKDESETDEPEPTVVEEPKPIASPVKANPRILTAPDSDDDETTKAKKARLKKFYAILSKVKGAMVQVHRDAEIQLKRSQLPIFAEEMNIVEAINENAVTVVCSETGSGKTTQIPQFLYEAGYTSNGHLIGITEPRRVAAMSMSKRVGVELNEPKTVSFQIRFEGNRTDDTKILFMTDGVLLKELQTDLLLTKYSVIIIDEAHERSMYSDVLIGLLSRICFLRAKKEFPLKLIIMSATLRLADFTQKRLFPVLTPKVVTVEARQFPVQIHFERRTPEDYMEAVFKKVCNIHEKLPDGAMLVFLSGQSEVRRLMRLLIGRYPMKGKEYAGHLTKKQKPVKTDAVKLSDFARQAKDVLSGKSTAEKENKPDIDELGAADAAILDEDFDGLDEDDDDTNPFAIRGSLAPPPPGMSPLFCLPLYSLLPSAKQKRVFDPPPPGTRLCVIATNVAETSLTIPDIRYVVDSGREKRRDYDPITGVSQFRVHWISQASAAQRSGRAGRVQAGHAYRMYSSAVFDDLPTFSAPEILNKPVDQLVLHLKAMNIVKVKNFPFPTPPNSDQLDVAEKRLVRLGALAVPPGANEAKVTPLGKTLSLFPLAPPFAKMLAMANQHALMPYVIYLVSALSVREPMVHVAQTGVEAGRDRLKAQKDMTEQLRQRQAWCGIGQARRLGDLTVLLKALGAADFGRMPRAQCEAMGLRFKAVIEIRKMRRQLVNLINASCSLKTELALDNSLQPPSDEQCRLLRQIVVACLPNQIAKKVDVSEDGTPVPKGAYQCQLLEEYVFIDSSSMLFKDQPDYVLYQEIVQFGAKKCLQAVCMVEPEWLPQLAEPYCQFSFQDAEKDPPRFCQKTGVVVQTATVTFGERGWKLESIDRPMPMSIDYVKHFARLFLAGFVCPKLVPFVSLLLASPETMIKPWAKLQKKTDRLLDALIAEDVTSRDRLLEVFAKKDDYLVEEYLEWLPAAHHDKVRLIWPPVD